MTCHRLSSSSPPSPATMTTEMQLEAAACAGDADEPPLLGGRCPASASASAAMNITLTNASTSANTTATTPSFMLPAMSTSASSTSQLQTLGSSFESSLAAAFRGSLSSSSESSSIAYHHANHCSSSPQLQRHASATDERPTPRAPDTPVAGAAAAAAAAATSSPSRLRPATSASPSCPRLGLPTSTAGAASASAAAAALGGATGLSSTPLPSPCFARNIADPLVPIIKKISESEIVYRERVPKILMNQYRVGRTLGAGSFAKVKEAIDLHALNEPSYGGRRHDGRVALKIFNKKQLRRIPGGLESVTREVQILNRLRVDALNADLLTHSMAADDEHHRPLQAEVVASGGPLVRIRGSYGNVCTPGDEPSSADRTEEHDHDPRLGADDVLSMHGFLDALDHGDHSACCDDEELEDDDPHAHNVDVDDYARYVVHILDHFQDENKQKLYVNLISTIVDRRSRD